MSDEFDAALAALALRARSAAAPADLERRLLAALAARRRARLRWRAAWAAAAVLVLAGAAALPRRQRPASPTPAAFVPLPGESLPDSGYVVALTVPADSLRALGVPVVAAATTPVPVEIVFGPDHVARGFRLAPEGEPQ